MIDKSLFNLMGSNKKIYITVALMFLGALANVGITAFICGEFCLTMKII